MIELTLALAAAILATGVATERVLAGVATLTRARAEARATSIMASAHRMQIIRTQREETDMSIIDILTGRGRRREIEAQAGATRRRADDAHSLAAAAYERLEKLELEIHTPDEDPTSLPLALRTGPAPASGAHFRTVGQQALIVRPPVEIDLASGTPTAGMTQARIGMYLSAMVGSQLGTTTNPHDITDWTVVDAESRLLRFRGYNHTTEAAVDLVIPVQPVSKQLDELLGTFRAGSLALSQQAHKDEQDLTTGQELLQHGLRRLHELVNADTVHMNRAERVMLETYAMQRLQHGAVVPFAEASGEQLAPWFDRGEDHPGRPVVRVQVADVPDQDLAG